MVKSTYPLPGLPHNHMATWWMSLHLHWSSATFFSSWFESCALNIQLSHIAWSRFKMIYLLWWKLVNFVMLQTWQTANSGGPPFLLWPFTHGKPLKLCCGIRLQDVSSRPFESCKLWGVDRIGQVCPAHPTDARLDCDQHLELILVRGHRH